MVIEVGGQKQPRSCYSLPRLMISAISERAFSRSEWMSQYRILSTRTVRNKASTAERGDARKEAISETFCLLLHGRFISPISVASDMLIMDKVRLIVTLNFQCLSRLMIPMLSYYHIHPAETCFASSNIHRYAKSTMSGKRTQNAVTIHLKESRKTEDRGESATSRCNNVGGALSGAGSRRGG